jgi:predicted adenine nucleotide alpha hydrolase (AANH) superfamily ATPase
MLTVDKNTIVEKYIPRTFENCEQCIAYRLTRCAEYAKSRGYDCFTTTLTISPHKDTAMVNKIGRDVSAFYGVPFLELDLKKNGGFARSVEMSKKLGLYRQNYCGCARSVRK